MMILWNFQFLYWAQKLNDDFITRFKSIKTEIEIKDIEKHTSKQVWYWRAQKLNDDMKFPDREMSLNAQWWCDQMIEEHQHKPTVQWEEHQAANKQAGTILKWARKLNDNWAQNPNDQGASKQQATRYNCLPWPWRYVEYCTIAALMNATRIPGGGWWWLLVKLCTADSVQV